MGDRPRRQLGEVVGLSVDSELAGLGHGKYHQPVELELEGAHDPPTPEPAPVAHHTVSPVTVEAPPFGKLRGLFPPHQDAVGCHVSDTVDGVTEDQCPDSGPGVYRHNPRDRGEHESGGVCPRQMREREVPPQLGLRGLHRGAKQVEAGEN